MAVPIDTSGEGVREDYKVLRTELIVPKGMIVQVGDVFIIIPTSGLTV